MAIHITANPKRMVYLMRGLPSSGKSYTARQLTVNGGLICETDEYFYQNRPQTIDHYHYSDDRLQIARDWNFTRFITALKSGVTPIVVDRGNSLDFETQRYVKSAIAHHYKPILREPTSPWWLDLRNVLQSIETADTQILEHWVDQLYQKNRFTHRTSRDTIRQRMLQWQWNLSIQEILSRTSDAV